MWDTVQAVNMVGAFQQRLLLLVCVDSLLQKRLKVKVYNQFTY